MGSSRLIDRVRGAQQRYKAPSGLGGFSDNEEFERIKQMIGRSFRGEPGTNDPEFTKSMMAMLPKWFLPTHRFMESLKGNRDVPS